MKDSIKAASRAATPWLTKDAETGHVSVSSGGSITGYASTFDREGDSYGDVVAKGAFKRTLAEWRAKGKPIPLLYGHNSTDPMANIGKITDAYEDERGLYVRAEFDPDNETAMYVRKLALEDRLFTFSFGYGVRKSGYVTINGERLRELQDIDLYEVSVVLTPANPHAVVTSVKGEGGNDELDETVKYGRALLNAIGALESADRSLRDYKRNH